MPTASPTAIAFPQQRSRRSDDDRKTPMPSSPKRERSCCPNRWAQLRPFLPCDPFKLQPLRKRGLSVLNSPNHSPLNTMNDRQNTVVATGIAGLVLVIVFLCPWRVKSSGEIRWSPIYQPPLSYVSSHPLGDSGRSRSRMTQVDAQIAFDVMALQVLALVLSAGAVYWLVSGSDSDDSAPPPPG